MKTFNKSMLVGALVLSANLAWADVAVVVSAKSGAGAMNKQQVSDLFLGKASAFPDGKQAVPVDQAESSAFRDEFHSKVTGKSGAQLKSFWSKQVFSGKGTPPKEVANSAEVKKLVADNPNMIGYIDKAAVDGSVKVVFAP